MGAYNIVNEDGHEGYAFLKDPAIVSSVESFLETINDTGVISKSMVLSLEETIADKIITDKYSLNMFTNTPSTLGVKETKNIIKNILNGDGVQRDAVYTLNDLAIMSNMNIRIINNRINTINNISNNINIELIESIKAGEVKYYNENNELTDIREFDIVDVVRQAPYYSENKKLFNNDALFTIYDQYERNENLIPDMVFLRLFSLMDLNESTNIMDLLTNGLERYTVGDVVEKLSSLNVLMDSLMLSKEYEMAKLKVSSEEAFTNRMITKQYKMSSRIYDILVNDLTVYYIALFTNK